MTFHIKSFKHVDAATQKKVDPDVQSSIVPTYWFLVFLQTIGGFQNRSRSRSKSPGRRRSRSRSPGRTTRRTSSRLAAAVAPTAITESATHKDAKLKDTPEVRISPLVGCFSGDPLYPFSCHFCPSLKEPPGCNHQSVAVCTGQ